MGTGTSESDVLATDEWRLRSVELILGPASDLESLFGALVGAVCEAGLVPHTVHCESDRDGYRLHASCDVSTELVTMERILRILRRTDGPIGSDACGSPAEHAA